MKILILKNTIADKGKEVAPGDVIDSEPSTVAELFRLGYAIDANADKAKELKAKLDADAKAKTKAK